MTLFGSKKGYSKSDINFFEEFTASARKQTQVLAVVVFIGIIAIGIALAVLAYDIFRNIGVQDDIDDLNATLASDEYAGLELQSQALQQDINDKNQYYYTLTEMRRIVDETHAAETSIAYLIGDCIPSDAYVSTYDLTGTVLSITGMTFSYYDAANICYLLNQSDVFTNYVVPNVEIDGALRHNEEMVDNPIDVYYDFSISGNLVNESIISIGHYANTETGVIALSGVSSSAVDAGSEFVFEGINTYTVNGVNYNLSSISINGNAVTPEQLTIAQSEDRISGIANGNVEIDLFYTEAPVEETAEEEAE